MNAKHDGRRRLEHRAARSAGRRPIGPFREKADAQEWLANATDRAIVALGLRGIEDVMVMALGPETDWEVFALARVRALICRGLGAAAEIGTASLRSDARSPR